MRKISIFLIIFALLTTIGCRTTQTVETENARAVQILMKPQRETIEDVNINDTKDVLKLLNYYEHLVQKWEAYSDCVDYVLGISEKMPTNEDYTITTWSVENGGIEKH